MGTVTIYAYSQLPQSQGDWRETAMRADGDVALRLGVLPFDGLMVLEKMREMFVSFFHIY